MKKYFIQEDSARKKNISHFTDKKVIGIGSTGCTMKCAWCLNKELVQKGEGLEYEIEGVHNFLDSYSPKDTIIGFCFNEPTFDWYFTELMARRAQSKGFSTYISTNGFFPERLTDSHFTGGYLNIYDSLFMWFDFIDLDIKTSILHDKEEIKKFESLTGTNFSTYFNMVWKFILEASKKTRRINATVLYIPDFYREDRDVKKLQLASLLNTLPFGSSITFRAFYAIPEICEQLSTSSIQETIEFYNEIKPHLVLPSNAHYIDPNYI